MTEEDAAVDILTKSMKSVSLRDTGTLFNIARLMVTKRERTSQRFQP